MGWIDIEEKLSFFKDNKVKIHLILFDGTFLNGYVISKTDKALVWIIQEDKLGRIFVFVKDIKVARQDRESKG